MRLFIDGNEVTVEALKQRLENLDCGQFDGGTFEVIALDYISIDGDLYFETEVYSTFGG